MFPAGSIVIPVGLVPVVPRMEETQAGVILDTLLLQEFAVYTFPAGSIVILSGPDPVVPRIEETQAGVILVTLLPLEFAV